MKNLKRRRSAAPPKRGRTGSHKLERQHINPAGIYKHPAFTRVVTVKGPMKLVFIAGQTPSDENYQCVAPGDYRAQYIKVMENLMIQLKAAGATFDDVVYRRMFVRDVDEYMKVSRDPRTPRYGSADKLPPSTLIGVTRLSHPDFLIEIDLIAVVPG
jgi:enamine deaminase RidA (YjgF/YER057c/UK114 family)